MNSKDEMLVEYDFSNGIRGKYVQAYKEGVNIAKKDNGNVIIKKRFKSKKIALYCKKYDNLPYFLII